MTINTVTPILVNISLFVKNEGNLIFLNGLILLSLANGFINQKTMVKIYKQDYTQLNKN